VAVELTAESAMALVNKIMAALKTGEAHHQMEFEADAVVTAAD
jgi:hypothetical protein